MGQTMRDAAHPRLRQPLASELPAALPANAPWPANEWPPPPHDPRERERILAVAGWELRLFGEHRFQYFVRHGFWHLQLWHPEAQVSVLSPSRLTHGLYEAFPIAGWKGRADGYAELSALVHGEHGIALPREATLFELERAFVRGAHLGSRSVS